ncbi:MAG: DUF2608 domain-containing protein [Chlamydiia bacterium]
MTQCLTTQMDQGPGVSLQSRTEQVTPRTPRSGDSRLSAGDRSVGRASVMEEMRSLLVASSQKQTAGYVPSHRRGFSSGPSRQPEEQQSTVLKTEAVTHRILELSHFADLTKHVDRRTLVLLDIDDTILRPRQMLGSDEWFDQQLQRQNRVSASFEEALVKTRTQWEAIRMVSHMELVEPETADVIATLQDAGHCIMGLTTQGFTLATCTSRQLAGHGIDLTKSAPTKSEHYFLNPRHGVLFRDGILFTGGTHKGKALFHWLDHLGLIPESLTFANDKQSHLREIGEVAHQRKVPFVGLRYSYSDARKQTFSMAIADHQWEHSTFMRLMTDDEARAGMA